MTTDRRSTVVRILGYAGYTMFALAACLRLFVFTGSGGGIVVVLFVVAIGFGCLDLAKD